MSKSRKLTLSLLTVVFAVALIFCGVFSSKNKVSAVTTGSATEAYLTENYDFWLDPTAEEGTSIASTKECGSNNGFILQASKMKFMSIDANVKTSADQQHTFTQRLKYEGSSEGNLDRTISFFLEQKAEITVYALSASSSDAERKLSLYQNGENTAISIQNVAATASAIIPLKFTTDKVGSYYFYCDGKAVNIYFIGIKYTGAAATPLNRAAWSSVVEPTIGAVNYVDGDISTTDTIEPSNAISVPYTGLVGVNGADKIVVTMYDSANAECGSRTVLKYSESGTVEFLPIKSDNFTFKAVASRFGETTTIASVVSAPFAFTLPLETPMVRARTVVDDIDSDGVLDDDEPRNLLTIITEVLEASSYSLEYAEATEANMVLINAAKEALAKYEVSENNALSLEAAAVKAAADAVTIAADPSADASVIAAAQANATTAQTNATAARAIANTDKTAAEAAEAAIDALYTKASKTPSLSGEIEHLITGLVVNKKYSLRVSASRVSTSETTPYYYTNATLRNEQERDWVFTYFGQSTKGGLNYMEEDGNIYDGLTLHSCTYDNENTIGSKGGKYTYGAMDGISYYYTKIDADKEDFVLRTRVSVDYLNPTPDGQEGFGLLIRDSIGINGDASYFYTNSAAALCTKIQYLQGTTNKTYKDGLGARFVTGVTDTSVTPATGTFTQKMYPFFYDTVVSGQKFYLEVEKKNNCYYTRYYGQDGVSLVEQYCLYYDENEKDQLRVIDKDNVYVGFSVARGCDATFDDISFKVTPRYEGKVEIEYEEVVGEYTITSPTTTSSKDYTFRFFANANGTLTASLNDVQFIKDEVITAYTDFEYAIKITQQNNEFVAVFTPDPNFVPDGQYVKMQSFAPQEVYKQLTLSKFGNRYTPIYCAPADLVDSPAGSPSGLATKESPLDIQTAINFVLPGQTIFMLPGTYKIYAGNLTMERGNNGQENAYKYLVADESCETRPVIDFGDKGTGVKMWGNYWHMYGFDITRTAKGNKGIQLGGKNNILEFVNTYYNGDSGVSVSGKSIEPFEKWPENNLILNCTSYMNKDKAEEDADGFASKLYCGEGNKFQGCIAYCNADDGWDLYAKTETGSIGAVTIENCLAFGNGFNIDGTSTKGNGNGFKLGGESLPGKHVLKNSVSFANKLKGIDSNSCPDDFVYNTTSVYNGKYNYAFYTTGSPTTDFTVEGIISLMGSKTDNLAVIQDAKPIKKANNYFYYPAESLQGAQGGWMPEGSYNSNYQTVTMDIFTGWDDSNADENVNIKNYFGFVLDQAAADTTLIEGDFEYIIDKVTVRKADGSINTNGFLELNGTQPENCGGIIYATAMTPAATNGFKFVNVPLIIIIVVVVVVVLAAAAVVIILLLKKKGILFANKKADSEIVATADEVNSNETTAEETTVEEVTADVVKTDETLINEVKDEEEKKD